MPKSAHNKTAAGHAKARIEALFASIGDGVIATDENGYISEINDAACEILGLKRSDLLGKWFPRAVKAIDEEGKLIDLMDRPVSQALLAGRPVYGRTFYKTTDNRRVPVAITVAPILLDNKPIGAIEVFRDISVEYEVDKMKSEFISIASHQLRTPLTAIKTYSHLLASGFNGRLNKQQQEFMEIILGSVDRMNELINTLLDISRIEEGRITISNKVISFEALMEEILSEQGPIAKSKDIKIELNYRSANLRFMTDPLLVKEVCANLLSNAIKYTPAGGTITISAALKKQHFIFIIQDTGYGIPRHEQVRVFTKFFRAENILDKDTTGTGLGLYMVKQIAENLGGTIDFKSSEKGGTLFRFDIPMS